jgi:hypothetical protein
MNLDMVKGHAGTMREIMRDHHFKHGAPRYRKRKLSPCAVALILNSDFVGIQHASEHYGNPGVLPVCN